jgi:hypothetical protein
LEFGWTDSIFEHLSATLFTNNKLIQNRCICVFFYESKHVPEFLSVLSWTVWNASTIATTSEAAIPFTAFSAKTTATTT